MCTKQGNKYIRIVPTSEALSAGITITNTPIVLELYVAMYVCIMPMRMNLVYANTNEPVDVCVCIMCMPIRMNLLMCVLSMVVAMDIL